MKITTGIAALSMSLILGMSISTSASAETHGTKEPVYANTNISPESPKTRNTGDRQFDFHLGAFIQNTYGETTYRTKENNSGVYEQTQNHSGTNDSPYNAKMTGWVRGGTSAQNHPGNYWNEAHGHYYDIAYNRTIHMYNLVHEHHLPAAAIAAGADAQVWVYATGVWSPDSK